MKNEPLICPHCGLVDDYRTELSGPHIKAICNGCDRYIKFIMKWKHTSETQQSKPRPEGTNRVTNIMEQGQGFYGSICIEDQFPGLIITAQDGRHYICIENLRMSPFSVGRNGKTYMSIGVWINEGVDQYGNVAGITLAQSKQEYEAREKKRYIGNLRRSGTNGTAQSPGPQQQQYAPQPQYGQQPQYPPQQPMQYPPQPAQPQQPAPRFEERSDLPF